jgi:YVTN family beta-propeller protein
VRARHRSPWAAGARLLPVAIVLLFLLSVSVLDCASGGPRAAASDRATSVAARLPGPAFAGARQVAAAGPLSGGANTVIASINIAGGPTSLGATFDPTNGYVYLGSNGTNLTVIDGATNAVTGQVYLGPYANPATPNYVGGAVNDLYVPVISTDPPPDNVTVVSGSTDLIVKYLSTGLNSYPTTGVFDPANGYLYVPGTGATDASNVTVINTADNTVVATIPVGGFPSTPAYDPADGDIYVPNTYDSNNLSIIDAATNTVVGSIPISFPSSGTIAIEDLLTESPVYDPVTHAIYQPDTGNATLTEIQGTSFVRNITVGAGPQTPAVDPVTGDLFVPIAFVNLSEYGSPSDNLSMVDVATNSVTQITVGESPETPVYDPVNNEMYVPCQVPDEDYGEVVALNATTGAVVATITVGVTPVIPAFDSTNDELYVPNFDGSNVTVIGAGPVTQSAPPNTYSVTFAETGLPAGAWWNVQFNGTTLNETGASIVFNGILNGSHDWTVGPWADRSTCSFTGSGTDTGSVDVQGASQRVAMPFSCTGSPGGGSGSTSGSSSSFLGLPGDDGYYLLGGIVVVAVAVVGSVLYLRGHRAPKGPSGGFSPPPPMTTGPWPPPPAAPPPPPPPPPPP